MRIWKPVLIALLATIAVIGGFFVTLIVAVTTVVYFVSRRLFGRPRPPLSNPPRPPSRPSRASPDAIEITATEVKTPESPLQRIEP